MVQGRGYDFFSVPIEASVFLAAVSAFAVLLLVVFMYVNKKWRLLDVSIGDEDVVLKPPPLPPLPLNGKHFRNQMEDFCKPCPQQNLYSESSDVVTRVRHSASSKSIYQNRPTLLSTSLRGYSLDQASSSSSPNHSHFKRMHVQHRSLDLSGPVSSEFAPSSGSNRYSPDFSTRAAALHHSRQQQHQYQQSQQQHLIVTNGEIPQDTGRSTHFTGSMSLRPLRVTMIRDVDGGDRSASSASRRRPRHQKGMTRSNTEGGRPDMISLAEKGKVCGGSSASSTSSNVSADDDHRQPQIPANLSPSKSQILSMGSQLNAARMSRHSKIPRNSAGDPNHPCRQHPVTIPSNVTNCSSGIGSHNHHLHHNSHSLHNFRRLVRQPRTNSIDSETPPTSEAGTSIYADEDGQIFEDDEMSTADGGDVGTMLVRPHRDTVSARNQYGRWDVAFDSEDSSDVKMTPRSLQALGVLSKEIGAANGTQVRILLVPRGSQQQQLQQRPRSKLSRGESINSGGGSTNGDGRLSSSSSRYNNGSCAEDGYTPMLQTSI